MTIYFEAPQNISTRDRSFPSVFLAGTIDMGHSENWQKKAAEVLLQHFNVFNPRRNDWDKTWSQEYTNPQFYQQVNWELNSMDQADCILMNILPDSLSPITLLELGKYAESGKVVVVCPTSYMRSGNVHIVCDRYNIPLFENISDALNYVRNNY